MFNEPNRPVENDAQDQGWSTGQGLGRAAWQTAIVAAMTAAALLPIAWWLPQLVLNMLLRGFIAFLVAWLMFGVAQRAAGMVGPAVSATAASAALLVMLTHNAVFAIHGVASTTGIVDGWIWIKPLTLAVTNMTALVGVGMCAILRHGGGGDINTLVEIFTRNVRRW